MENIATGRAAEALLAEHKAKLRFKTLGPPQAPATISDAYDIQDRYVALLRGEHGAAVGYKVGLTSAAMQAFCGIDHPIAGVVLARRVHRSGATVRRSNFGRLGLEFEIAVRLKSDVPVTGLPRSNWSTIATLIMPVSMCCRWWRTIPGTAASCCRNLPRHGPIWRACLGAPPKTVLRSAKDMAAISSGIPSIRSHGWPRNWLRAASG
jgi:hypothetical protein